MNIWLRRALERQAESAIAEAMRDGKPIPEAAVATVASIALGAAAATPTQAAAVEPKNNDASTSAKTLAAPPVAPKTSFAELMRQHREGLVPPSAQPPVKVTTVVKRPKGTKSPTPVGTPAAEEALPAPAPNKKCAARSAGQARTAPEAAPATLSPSEVEKTAREEGEPTQTTPTTEADSSATASAAVAVHQAAVRKRSKATNSVPAKRAHDTSAATSAAATPTHVTTVKGKASLEELRARRNRTTAGGSANHHNTPHPGEGGAGVASSSGAGKAGGGHSQQDEYNDSALDAVSRLLLRYCVGDRTTVTVPSTVAATNGVDVSSSSTEPVAAPSAESPPASTQTTTELEFLNELMEFCENDSVTPASLELLRELFQHVRVLPRPASASNAGKNCANADAGAPAVQDGMATMVELDAEAYREAARRREYVQQVIMVLLNRLKHMKTQEQRQRQKCCGDSAVETSTSAVAASPQPATAYGAPFIKVGGVSLAPPPMSSLSQQQQQSGIMYPQGQRTASAAPWPSMAEMASAYPDEAAAAAFTSDMMAYGYPNPYAHLTVFSQHQPVAPPVGWPSPFHSPTAGARRGRYGHHGSKSLNSNSDVAARLVASPFPGAFPIIPPPATTDTSADAEDHEMQELFRMIRTQLTQPVNTQSSSVTAISSQVESSVSLSGTAPVEVSQEERAVLRHVQMDFKKHMEEHQQQQLAAAEGSPVPQPPPPTAPTPPTASLTAPPGTDATPPRRMHATPGATADTSDSAAGTATVAAAATQVESSKSQRDQTLMANQANCLEEKGEAAGESPSARSTTAPAQQQEEEGGILTGKTAPAKPRGTTLSLNAKPFVPGGARGGSSSTASAIIKLTATTGSTPTKTTFNYHAKPFLPSGNASSLMPAPPQKPAKMNVAAPAFVSKQQQQQQQQAIAFPSVTFSPPTSAPPLNAPTTSTPAMPSPLPKCVADPWASYEMFARWRDMMEAYYQNVFAMQNAAATTTGPSSSSATAGGAEDHSHQL
ncbi:conserved hypothetical protein [Leishmania major strain Friedlin]|uniref:Uncharacterized protein n=1 Tax=Leishmania major TaxID=5664 RepID=Q4QHS6_LEIMA|nr:conserved hypothetical protein [Leishmania major strain Friedlin]CAG9569713.1 hypothetical_protein_-__conserved [Leishmania major strain Friedlin]CAJ02804.2 conserved hypothetical protein [Leishmania major strain Friedlin]|eukprot:XP_001681272.2 conserved hypothetical protein [Leishmania major strain Friedlin]